MKIIACQSGFIMTDVKIIDLDATDIRFENDRYHQIWHFDSEEESEEAFTAVWKEIHDCILSGRNCLLDEAIIKARVRERLNQDEEIKQAGKHAR